MRRSTRIHAIEAARLLNDFVGDLVIGSRAVAWLDIPSRQPAVGEELKITVHRMCMWHVIVTLSKWQEVYDCYKGVFPKDVWKASDNLRAELELRGVRDFRNKVVGHILDKKTKQPIAADDISRKLEHIFKGSYESFLLWINNPAGNIFPETVVSVVEQIRDRIIQQHALTPAELFPWKQTEASVAQTE